MRKAIVLAAVTLAVSVASASARTPAKHHKVAAKVTTEQLYDYVPASQNSLAMPLILGTTY